MRFPGIVSVFIPTIIASHLKVVSEVDTSAGSADSDTLLAYARQNPLALSQCLSTDDTALVDLIRSLAETDYGFMMFERIRAWGISAPDFIAGPPGAPALPPTLFVSDLAAMFQTAVLCGARKAGVEGARLGNYYAPRQLTDLRLAALKLVSAEALAGDIELSVLRSGDLVGRWLASLEEHGPEE